MKSHKASLGASLAVLFCFAATGAKASELRDVKTLSLQEQKELMVCTLSEMGEDRSVEIAEIRARHAPESSGPKLKDPAFEAMIDMALSLQLGQMDCAKKMGVDPKTLPAVTFK
ncbi:MAG: hypothetical protein ACXW4B_11770 [Micavibrio sp.]